MTRERIPGEVEEEDEGEETGVEMLVIEGCEWREQFNEL